MEAALKPKVLDLEVGSTTGAKKFTHWAKCATNFITNLVKEGEDKEKKQYSILINYVSEDIYELISEVENFTEAMTILKGHFVKKVNIIYQRHLLASRKQEPTETINDFVLTLKSIAKEAEFKDVTAKENLEHSVRDALINGMRSSVMRQKVLESNKQDLDSIVELCVILESSQKNAAAYTHAQDASIVSSAAQSNEIAVATRPATGNQRAPVEKSNRSSNVRDDGRVPVEKFNRSSNVRDDGRCSRCGYPPHKYNPCPAIKETCRRCGRVGHFQRCCFSNNGRKQTQASALHGEEQDQSHFSDFGQSDDQYEHSYINSPFLASIKEGRFPWCLEKSKMPFIVNNISGESLVDSGAGFNFVSPAFAKKAGLNVIAERGEVGMASMKLSTPTSGYALVDITLAGTQYKNVKVTVLPDAVADIILGLDFLKNHSSVTFQYGGKLPPLVCGSLGEMKINPIKLFPNLTPDVHPIRTKSRRFSQPDRQFISSEISRMLKEGIIEKSRSPWRAQVHVVKNQNHKKRLTIDYSETINKFTQLDAYPVPRIDDLVEQIAQYTVFSTIDLKSAYHQYPIREEDAPYTAFEAEGGLYQFKRLPFGVTNGVAIFQREMDNFVKNHDLKATFPYMDNITICGRDQKDHDLNLKAFREAASRVNLTYNDSKCEFSVRRLCILGSVIENGEVRPDPNRMKPLLELAPPNDIRSLRRTMGFFAHYAQWIRGFSEKIKPLSSSKQFPLQPEAIDAFHRLKNDVIHSVVKAVDESKQFTVETDASDTAIAASLNQEGKPVAFFSRPLNASEIHHASVEKEALAVVEAVRHWRHYLLGRKFNLVTDQKSVVFMFSSENRGKIKNDKIIRWRLELACYNYNIIHKPGVDNVVPDALSRAYCSTTNVTNLLTLHKELSHPGVTRMCHFIKVRNLPYTVEEVRSMTRTCKECCEVKPQFHKPTSIPLITATQPFEKLDIDFKGPLPSHDKNVYFLQVIDEFSRFPFVFPCSDLSTKTVINKLCELFSIFGMPSKIHSDRGASFMSDELKSFLSSKGIASSRTTPYHPQGNGLVEKSNGTIWKAVTMALKTKSLPQSCWQLVLPDVLHSIRTLLCTSTNQTPHERLFAFPRRSGTGISIPTWLATPGRVLLRRFVRTSKQDPLVDEVELLQANNHYALVKFPGGREGTVSTRDLAPMGHENPTEEININKLDVQGSEHVPKLKEGCEMTDVVPNIRAVGDVGQNIPSVDDTEGNLSVSSPSDGTVTTPPLLRRSERNTKGKPPARLGIEGGENVV